MNAEKTIELRNNLHRKLKEHEYVLACSHCAIGAVQTSNYAAKKAMKNRSRCFKCNRQFEIMPAKTIIEATDPWKEDAKI